MDMLERLLTGGHGADLQASSGGAPGPADDYWYQPVGTVTPAGMRVDEKSAQTISAWYRGRDLLATILAMLPLKVYQYLPNDGGSEPVANHPLYHVLHDQPNTYQDSFQYRRQKMYHLIDHGNGYDWIVAGPRGFVDQLCPIHPRLVTPRPQLATLPTGATVVVRMLYDVRNAQTGASKTWTSDDIFHTRGASDDGFVGKGILEYARGSLGTALATESYAARIFSRGTLNAGVIENPGLLDDKASERMAKTFVTPNGDWHLPKILEQGSKWIKDDGMTPENAQMLLSRRFGVDDIARWLGMSRQMLENSDPSFGNAEQFDENLMTYTMGNWLSLFEFAIKSQLILAPGKYYAEFVRDAIVRGKFLDRAQGNVALVNAGIVSVDEVRAGEGKNKRGGKADELRDPQNITGKPVAADPSSTPPPTQPRRPPSGASARAELIAVESAARLLRKEVAAIQRLAVRHAADQDAFAAAVADFYATHAALVSETLLMSIGDAEGYCATQASQVLNGGWLAALEQWSTESYAAGLAGLALEEVV